MNFLAVDVQGLADGNATVSNPSLKPISIATKGRNINTSETAILGIRPQYLTPVDPDKGMLQGTVSLTERCGSETVVDIVLRDGTKLIAAISEDKVLASGTDIGLNFAADQAHLFERE